MATRKTAATALAGLMLIMMAALTGGCASEEEKAAEEFMRWVGQEQELREERSQSWQAEHYQDPITDEIDLHLWRGSKENTDPGHIAIAANCRKEVSGLRVDVNVMNFSWGDDLGTGEVTVRFGEEDPVTELWTWRDIDNLPTAITPTALEPPRSKSEEYLNKIAAGEVMAVRYTESDGVNTHTPVFDTEGLPEALNQAAADHCGGMGARTTNPAGSRRNGADSTRNIGEEIRRSVEATVEAVRSTRIKAEEDARASTEATAIASTREAEAEFHRSVYATLTAQVGSTTTQTVIPRSRTSTSAGTATKVRHPSPAGDDCDQLLRNQLVFQRGASTATRMQEVIRQIQAQRDECTPNIWTPVVDDNSAANCFRGNMPTLSDYPTAKVGSLVIPRTLYTESSPSDTVRRTSGRDSDNNIIVYWSGTDGRSPADGAACWLYHSRLNEWSEE